MGGIDSSVIHRIEIVSGIPVAGLVADPTLSDIILGITSRVLDGGLVLAALIIDALPIRQRSAGFCGSRIIVSGGSLTPFPQLAELCFKVAVEDGHIFIELPDMVCPISCAVVARHCTPHVIRPEAVAAIPSVPVAIDISQFLHGWQLVSLQLVTASGRSLPVPARDQSRVVDCLGGTEIAGWTVTTCVATCLIPPESKYQNRLAHVVVVEKATCQRGRIVDACYPHQLFVVSASVNLEHCINLDAYVVIEENGHST